jgi:hypothetical protein
MTEVMCQWVSLTKKLKTTKNPQHILSGPRIHRMAIWWLSKIWRHHMSRLVKRSMLAAAIVVVGWKLLLAGGNTFDNDLPQEERSDVVGGWQLCVRYRKQYHEGAPISICLLLTNTSEDTLWLGPPTWGITGERLAQLGMLDPSGKECTRTEYGRQLLEEVYLGGSTPVIKQYGPGRSQEREVDLSQIFQLETIGIYRLSVTVEVKSKGHKHVMRLKEETPPIKLEGEEPRPLEQRWWPAADKDNDSRESVAIEDIPIVIVRKGHNGIQDDTLPKVAVNEGVDWLVPSVIIAACLFAGIVIVSLLRRKHKTT